MKEFLRKIIHPSLWDFIRYIKFKFFKFGYFAPYQLDKKLKKYLNRNLIKDIKISKFNKFIKNSSKYLPILKDAKYYGSFYVVRSVDKDKNDKRITNISRINNKIYI